MSTNTLPTTVFGELLEKLVRTLEVAQQSDSVLTPQSKQVLFQATTDFKESLAHAKDVANSLPGGELLIEEQDEIITMLEQLRDLKRSQLAKFSVSALSTPSGNTHAEMKIEVDSTASSPHED